LVTKIKLLSYEELILNQLNYFIMKNVSIFGKKWIDLVFEGKNKAYGAYQLRQENSKTTLMAFVYGLLFLVSISGLGLLLSSFAEKPVPNVVTEKDAPPIVVTLIHRNEVKPEIIKPAAPRVKTTAVVDKILKNPIIVVPNDAENNLVKTTAANNVPSSENGVVGTSSTVIETGGNGSEVAGIKDNTTIVTTNLLDKQPSFPGGMEKFYAFVGKNYKTPDVELETTIKVYVSFVIEPDGSMSNIKVIRDPGYGFGKEAIRVLTALKTKWEAGVLDGEKVRTAYNLPIAVKVD
jgi:periplasmic protein TonB